MSVESLIALTELRRAGRMQWEILSRALQRSEAETRAILDRLVDAGLVRAYGAVGSREYSLSETTSLRLGHPVGSSLAPLDSLDLESLVLNFVRERGRITRRETAELCGLNSDQAKHLLLRLAGERKLVSNGGGRSVFYTRP